MSLRLAVLNVGCRLVGKTRLRYVQKPGSQRKDFDYLGRVLSGRKKDLSERVEAGEPSVTVTEPADGPSGTILYFHGGGYIAGSPLSHRALIRSLVRRSGARVVAPDYRLGPEHRLPAAQEDARAAWDALVAKGTRAEEIVLAGDSAGGGMALSLMAELGAEGVRPAACVAFCPWTDLTGSGASMVENAKRDPLLPVERLPDLIGFAVAEGADLADPRLSPLFAKFSAPAPTLIQHSQTEIVRDDALRMADVLRGAGGEVVVQDWPNPPHTWHIFGDALPEARDALEKAAQFIKAQLRLA
ncbi:alpha/beta hydrolase [Gymnodinialimonas hymeniacidonis]|uniref:alpha/beta hydrolase n=1 Tax=Gymnodinialimonas hymeniacidonis TaxID=3126508 RepID=UPI0034C6A96E